MVVAAHVVSFALRLLSECFSATGLLLLTFNRSARTSAARVFIFLGLACLMASACVVSPEVQQTAALSLVFLVLLVCERVYAAKAGACPNLFLVSVTLAGIGSTIIFDTAPEYGVKFSTLVVGGSVACVALANQSKKHCDFIASSYARLLALGVVLCALPLIPGIGIAINGARSWVRVGPFSFQPSEFAKVVLAASLSGYLSANARRIRELNSRGFLPISLAFCLALALELLANDLGTGIVLFSLFASMLSLCSRRAGVVYGMTLLLCVVVLVIIAAILSPHVTARFAAWRDPYADPQGIGYQSIKALETMRNGGLIGTGLNFGLLFVEVPEVYSDYVFAAIVEELGIVGGTCVCLAFVAFSAIVARAVRNLPEASFERNLMIGGGCLLASQAFIIIGGVVGLIPLTGVTLPFVSLGGSSMLGCFLLVGLMGGCASASESRGVRMACFVPALLPGAVTLAMLLCVYSLGSLNGELCLVGTTKRQLTYGRVLTLDGVVLAESQPEDSGGGRMYPEGALAAHLLGEASGGVEPLVCRRESMSSDSPLLNVLALPEVADDTVLTIDSRVQREAERQLSGVTGAIVAMDTSTGAVLAMASSPSYDVADGFDPEAGADVSYLNRATRALYAPGSTFKVVTMAAALENHLASPQSIFTGDPLSLSSGDVITNYNNAKYGDISLTEALKVSSNTAFAQLSLLTGGERIEEMCSRLGFNTDTYALDVGASPSSYVTPIDDCGLAWSAVGQPTWKGGTQYGPSATVLQMCTVMSAIANSGVLESPFLVASGPIAKNNHSSVTTMSEQSANSLWEMLVEASDANLQGIEVAGKTGTAQSGGGTLCWYICSTDGVAVACCVESNEGELGYTVAKPRAIGVLKSAATA